MSLYPYKATIYVYSLASGKAAYTKGESFQCSAEQSPSKTRNTTGAVTTADAMVFCGIVGGAKVKKQDRLYVERTGQADIYDVVKPERIRNHHYEIYAKLISNAKVDSVTGAMS